MSNIQKLRLAEINILAGTQSRAGTNNATVKEYIEALEQGVEFPPVVVYTDGSENGKWLADGFHRYEAHQAAERIDIVCDVRNGSRREAVLFSVGANASHGLRRTIEDKRRAVAMLLEDAEWSTWSDRDIARQCGVSHSFVAAVRSPAAAARQRENRQQSAVKKYAEVESDSTGEIEQSAECAPPRLAPPAADTPSVLVQQVLGQEVAAASPPFPPDVDNADAPDFGAASLLLAAPAEPLTIDDIDDDDSDYDLVDRLSKAEDQVKQLERECNTLKARVKQLEEGDLAAQIVKLEQDLRGANDRAARHYEEFTKANTRAINRAELLDKIRRTAGLGKDVDLVDWVKQAARRAA